MVVVEVGWLVGLVGKVVVLVVWKISKVHGLNNVQFSNQSIFFNFPPQVQVKQPRILYLDFKSSK